MRPPLPLLLLFAAGCTFGGSGADPFTPAPAARVAEADLDVPYVPTPRPVVEAMLDLAELGAEDYLIDLGSGDGRIAIMAAQRGARALGVDVDRWITPVFGFGVALAALGGVLAAPTRNVAPLMGADLIITIFAVVVIGGLGSIVGAVVAGFLVGVITSLGAVFFPPLANTLVFILMAVVLLVRPAGLFGSVEAT